MKSFCKESEFGGIEKMKIVQLLMTPNNNTWQGRLLGLGDDGVTYELNDAGRWEPLIPPPDGATGQE